MPVNTYITANGRIRRRCTYYGGVATDQVAVVTNALSSVVATYKDGWLTADRSGDVDDCHSEYGACREAKWVAIQDPAYQAVADCCTMDIIKCICVKD